MYRLSQNRQIKGKLRQSSCFYKFLCFIEKHPSPTLPSKEGGLKSSYKPYIISFFKLKPTTPTLKLAHRYRDGLEILTNTPHLNPLPKERKLRCLIYRFLFSNNQYQKRSVHTRAFKGRKLQILFWKSNSTDYAFETVIFFITFCISLSILPFTNQATANAYTATHSNQKV